MLPVCPPPQQLLLLSKSAITGHESCVQGHLPLLPAPRRLPSQARPPPCLRPQPSHQPSLPATTQLQCCRPFPSLRLSLLSCQMGRVAPGGRCAIGQGGPGPWGLHWEQAASGAELGEPAPHYPQSTHTQFSRLMRKGVGPSRLKSNRWVPDFHTVTVLLNLNLMCFWNP